MAEETDERLMQRFQRGDARAFEALVHRHRTPVFSFLARLTADRGRAEDTAAAYRAGLGRTDEQRTRAVNYRMGEQSLASGNTSAAAQNSTAAAQARSQAGSGWSDAFGAIANIDKGEISFNQASGVLSEGGGIYCDTGCTLNITDSSIMANSATDSGGGIYVAPGGTLDMRQTSVGDNNAVNGSGVYSLGSIVNFFGNVIADNGVGAAGDDLNCAGGTFSTMVPEDAALNPIPGLFSLIENPSASCGAGGAVVTRGSMTPGLQDRVFYDIVNTMFNTPPTRAYRVADAFNAYAHNVVPVDAQAPLTGQLLCAGHSDQHGRVMATGTQCDIGSTQLPVMYEPILGANGFANGINDKGQIVGIGISEDFERIRAFLWPSATSEVIDLTTFFPAGSDWDLDTIWPTTINNRGEIIGSGSFKDGTVHNFVLIPGAWQLSR